MAEHTFIVVGHMISDKTGIIEYSAFRKEDYAKNGILKKAAIRAEAGETPAQAIINLMDELPRKSPLLCKTDI